MNHTFNFWCDIPKCGGDVFSFSWSNNGSSQLNEYKPLQRDWILQQVGETIRGMVGSECCSEPCSPIDTGLAGLNCCTLPQFGATWYIAYDENDCPYLDCYTGSCRDCPPYTGPTEGTPCECADGSSGNGVHVYIYDENGCPIGTYCDECEPCPQLSGEGEPCQCRSADGTLRDGKNAVRDGEDGCPELYCQCDDCPELFGEGEDCECRDENGEIAPGKRVKKQDGDNCPYLACQCTPDKCKDKGGDNDKDGCCDDEDPDPDDKDKSCTSCEDDIKERFTNTVNLFRSKVGITNESVENEDWSFSFSLTRGFEDLHLDKFGIAVDVDFTNLTSQTAEGEVSGWITEFASWRTIFRQIVGYSIWFTFSFAILRLFVL